MRIKTTLFFLTFCFSVFVLSDERADEQAVWSLEEAYWTYVKRDDTNAYLELWDERFIGWPSFGRTPLGKDSIGTWISPLHEDPSEIFDYTLILEAVRSFGDVVITQYLVRSFYSSADTGEILRERGVSRITHTWRRSGNSWQIITGMSAVIIENDGIQ